MAMPNRSDQVVIDANFSTAWSDGGVWTAAAISTLLRSTWVRACMEAVGTPMGGGALKLEATQLNRLPVPKLPVQAIMLLATMRPGDSIAAVDLIVSKAVFGARASMPFISRMNERLLAFIETSEQARQRV